MKYKNKLKKLSIRQSYWDRMGANYQRANKKPGSQSK